MSQLEEMRELWEAVKPIRSRCHNATKEDMDMIKKLVSSYNGFIGKPRLKTSACQVPHIVHTVAKLLKGHGIIDSIYAK